ncbi:YkgJ family cysteine cluster protein [Singulisphaera rosea]
MAPETGPTPESRAETVTANVTLNLAGTPMSAEITVPTSAFPLQLLMPTFRSLAEAIIDQSVERVKAEGLTVSCRSRCGACCRQLVPISEVEARMIRDMVEEFPEPRRSQIQERFAEARRRLDSSGLLVKLLNPEAFSDEELRPFALEYFAQGIACPFLEDESCSIYEERPIACREYLVTSPVANCSNPNPESVHCVPLAAKASRALSRIGEDPTKRFIRWVPLIVALDWAEHHPDDLPPRPGPDWLREFFERLTGREIPKSPSSEAVDDESGATQRSL